MVGDRQSANLARTILFNRKAYLQRTLPHQPYQSHHVGLGDLHEALAFVMRLRCWIHQSNSELLKRWLGHLSLHGFSTSVYYWYIYIYIYTYHIDYLYILMISTNQSTKPACCFLTDSWDMGCQLTWLGHLTVQTFTEFTAFQTACLVGVQLLKNGRQLSSVCVCIYIILFWVLRKKMLGLPRQSWFNHRLNGI